MGRPPTWQRHGYAIVAAKKTDLPDCDYTAIATDNRNLYLATALYQPLKGTLPKMQFYTKRDSLAGYFVFC